MIILFLNISFTNSLFLQVVIAFTFASFLRIYDLNNHLAPKKVKIQRSAIMAILCNVGLTNFCLHLHWMFLISEFPPPKPTNTHFLSPLLFLSLSLYLSHSLFLSLSLSLFIFLSSYLSLTHSLSLTPSLIPILTHTHTFTFTFSIFFLHSTPSYLTLFHFFYFYIVCLLVGILFLNFNFTPALWCHTVREDSGDMLWCSLCYWRS